MTDFDMRGNFMKTQTLLRRGAYVFAATLAFSSFTNADTGGMTAPVDAFLGGQGISPLSTTRHNLGGGIGEKII
jgi:hypothetical protein